MATNKPAWKEGGAYSGYLRQVQQVYMRQPVVRASVQLILSIFSVAFFAFFAIRPTLSSITTILKTIEDLQDTSRRLDVKIVQLNRAQEVLGEQGAEIEELVFRAVPDEPDLGQLARQVELLANENGVVVTVLAFGEAPVLGDKKSLTESGSRKIGEEDQFIVLSFGVGGSQEGVLAFLAALESMERVVRLTQTEISRPEAALRNNVALVVNGKATIYYRPN